MKLMRKAFLEKLKLAMPGIESGKSVIQGSDSFVFHDGSLFTYNDSVAVLVPLDSTDLVDEGLEGAVHAKELYNVVSKFTSDEMTLTVKDGKSWEVKCGRAKVKLTLLDFDYGSRLSGVSPKEEGWVAIGEDFMTALSVCRMQGNKSKMAGVYVTGRRVVSTDGYQMNLYEMDGELPTFWIADASVVELLKLKGIQYVQMGRNWVHFRNRDGVVFSVKTLNDSNYPYEKISKLIGVASPSEDDLHATFPKELMEAIERADNFSMDLMDQRVVRLVLGTEGTEVSCERNSGGYSEMVPWTTPLGRELEPTKVYVDADMMKAMAGRSLEFYLIYIEGKSGKLLPRMVFTTPSSKHIMATFLE